MPSTKGKPDTVTFPLSVFETADTIDDLEDWLLSHDANFVRKMRKSRQDDLAGKGTDWKTLKKRLCFE
jgi:hypothetical protein